MREDAFKIYLSNDPSISSPKAIDSRLARARKAEAILGISLDTVVNDDDTMFEALQKLKPFDGSTHNQMQNAVRKYYKFTNGKAFPVMKNYHSPKHP